MYHYCRVDLAAFLVPSSLSSPYCALFLDTIFQDDVADAYLLRGTLRRNRQKSTKREAETELHFS